VPLQLPAKPTDLKLNKLREQILVQSLNNTYLAEIAGQLAFLSALLGGFAAAFLVTVLTMDKAKRSVDWVIGSSAVSACGFIVAVVASVMLTIVLHPDAPSNAMHEPAVNIGRIVSSIGFWLGIVGLLLSVGVSGWIRSRKLGLVTSSVALVTIILVHWAIIGFK
jgi:hypothetical protein